MHLKQTVCSVRFKFLSTVQRLFTPTVEWLSLLGKWSAWGLQKRGWRKEDPVLTTNSLRFLCHPLEVKYKKTHREEMEVLVKENETSLDSVCTSIPIELTSTIRSPHYILNLQKYACLLNPYPANVENMVSS